MQDILGTELEQLRGEARSGKFNFMESATKAQQELEKIERQIGQLETLARDNEDAQRQLKSLQEQVEALRKQISAKSDAWIRTELARHPQRPYFLDYVERIFADWSEIHGDRSFADDPAILCGMADFHGRPVCVIGMQKGRDTKQKVYRNFGMPSPEGYRKALRVMKLAEKFGRPVITLVDVPGANPGLGAEERGQAEAIARNLREMARLEVPIITAITGEGGSGGALAIAVADRVLMMENAIYSVISPEGCASIMWRDASKRELAAEALRITATDLIELGCIDEIISEPEGGAQVDYDAAAALLDVSLQKHLSELEKKSPADLVISRYDKFRGMARFFEQV
ncbi:MAG TPA: acetyl-CoA carboxylase carboxyltransferase subunit alpha [Terriglobales bacterium]|nr:acetyl-CoA carboxylase carboxyltransferase subunit alpha [Terriglobales bacterium]